MITWLLLVSLFCKSTQDGNGRENGALHCGPQNLSLTSSNQMILLTWEDDPSCSTVQSMLTYKLEVLIADKQVHTEEVALAADQIGSTHSWNWTSHLPLECASHSVRLTNKKYKNHTSPWQQEKSLPGRENSKIPEVFPRDKNFKVGSIVTFCCVLPVGESFSKMYLTGDTTDVKATKINNRAYEATVHLNQASIYSGTDVTCHTNKSRNGATVYIGYPPSDSDLQCETRDLESVECDWTVGRETDLRRSQNVYQLLGRPCVAECEVRCCQKVQVDVGERNWTLTAQNGIGKVELVDKADLTKRVHMFAPEKVRATNVNARNVSLEWVWKVQQYNNLNITCQLNISQREANTIREKIGVGLNFAVLDNLIPNWAYNVKVRCGTTQHHWKWSNWSESVNFDTRGDVPDDLDVWMQMKDERTLIVWNIPLANQSHGPIIDYEVTWARTTERKQQNRTKVAQNKNSLALNQDGISYIVTVTARNVNGSSSPSTITIPSFSPENFSNGVRYLLSIYACTQGAPVLLERREGYVSEERIEDGLFKSLKWKQQYSDVEVYWDPIPLREQTAFIQGYALYCLDNNNNVVINVSKADNLIKAIFISLVAVFVLLSLITILCYGHWTCIKQKVYPPIPKPVLTDKWLTSLGEHSCHRLDVDPCHHSEADVMDVPEVYCKTEALGDGYVSQENMPSVFAQTPKGYYNQPLKKYTPPPLTLPTIAIPCQPELSSSAAFRRIFPNPSYNLIFQSGDQQSNSDPEFREGPPLERSSSGYQPQSKTKTFTVNQINSDPESPMSCVSTYILLPQLPSK
ncbi:hypothetical protein L3Q82_012204 [Scortum barcoo]|uniref:Uncharacterized protein n=1 Tax=Scortum barcoo TaxID=214431 RepID=A0ACB8W2I4_9TELE|nr:hypothetical protein L3Q82_012204 [Scortum barcoo]